MSRRCTVRHPRTDSPVFIDPLERRVLLSGRVVGYFPEYRWSSFGNIDFDALTHLNYFSVSANTDGSLSTSNVNLSHLATAVATAHSQGDTISITVGPQSFSTLIQSPTSLNNFVNNIVNFAQTHNLDGIDIDWEPTPTGSNKTLYGNLIDALHARTSTAGLLLSAAVNPINHEIPLPAIAKMDWLNVMGYDFAPANHSTYNDAINGLNGWANYGVPKEKLVLGVPFYGRKGTTWQNTTALTYNGILNNYFNVHGMYPSPELDLVDGWYFNGKTTIANKANYVMNNGFGGIMIWELGQDHFVGGQYTSMSLLPVIQSIVLADPVPPAVNSSSFHFATAPHQLSFTFSEDVSSSLQTSDLIVRDTTTQASIIVTGVTWNGATNTATFTLNNVIPDGNYRATLSGTGVTDAGGNPLGADHTYDFFFLTGDADHNGAVNLDDFNILAANFGQSNRDFTQGDFSYDGTVNLTDFNLLASRFGTTFAPATTTEVGDDDDASRSEDAGNRLEQLA